MVDESDESDVKLVDFGLSKTLGPGETCKEPFGTLCYVAPEILLQRSYDKSVDLWSLGVIIHLMLSGTLPFDSEDDREIARKTIYDEVKITHPVWQRVSDDAKDLVLCIKYIIITFYSIDDQEQKAEDNIATGARTPLDSEDKQEDNGPEEKIK